MVLWLPYPPMPYFVLHNTNEGDIMLSTDLLRNLASANGGVIPNALELSDEEKDLVAQDVMKNNDKEAIEYIRENQELLGLYTMAAEDAVRELQNSIWAAIESSVSDQIDEYNADMAGE